MLEDDGAGVLESLEHGTVDVVITDGRPDAIREKVGGAEVGVLVRVVDSESLTAACDATREHPWTVIEFKDPTKIPLEIVLAAAHGSAGRIITRVHDVEEAGIVFDVLEHGSDGIVLAVSDPGQATALKRISQGGMPTLDLVELSVVGISHVGLGDRVCVDTCTYFAEDEGILVGSTSKGMVLTCSETHPLPYMPNRPFRSNAGAVHSYTLVSEERTNYLTELRAGSKVLAVNAAGRTRPVVVGRSKIESRPLLSIDLTAPDGRSAVVDTDVVWIPQNFENTILARYVDDVVQEDGRWLFRRREEFPIEHRPGPPPMSDTAVSVSSPTMRGPACARPACSRLPERYRCRACRSTAPRSPRSSSAVSGAHR